jgi:vacuolar-type H+-ATPase subunit E/Vma4
MKSEVIKIGLQELETKIRKDSAEEINKLAAETKKEIEAIEDGINAKADNEVEKVRKEGEGEVLRVKKRIIADANTQVKELLSAEKNRVLEEVFDEAAKAVLALPNEEKKKILASLAKEGRQVIKDPKLLVDGKYKGMLEGAEASDLGDFGVVIASKDGSLRIDNTIGSRMKQLKATLKPKLAALLFAEG